MSGAELIDAIKGGEADRVGELLMADPGLATATDEAGVPAVLVALYHRQGAIAERLASAKGELDLLEAAALGRPARAEAILEAEPSRAGERSADGFTALHLACFMGQPECARILVEAGADVNAVADNPPRVRPLHSAVASRQSAIAEMLLDHGAEVDARQQAGYTSLHAAALHGDEPLVRLLLDRGADPRLTADDGTDAAGFARKGGFEDLAGRLET
jgi:ankyrin repeat protein